MTQLSLNIYQQETFMKLILPRKEKQRLPEKISKTPEKDELQYILEIGLEHPSNEHERKNKNFPFCHGKKTIKGQNFSRSSMENKPKKM